MTDKEKRIIDWLRNVDAVLEFPNTPNMPGKAADAIERLIAEVERLTRERDAAIDALHKCCTDNGICDGCKFFGQDGNCSSEEYAIT